MMQSSPAITVSTSSTSPTMADGSSTTAEERWTVCRRSSTPCEDGRRSSSTADSAEAPISSKASRSAPMPYRLDGSIFTALPPPGRQAFTACWSCWKRKSKSDLACSAPPASPSSTSPACRPWRLSPRPTSSARFRCWRSPNSSGGNTSWERQTFFATVARRPRSQPILPLEENIGQRRRYQHQHNRKRVAVLPLELGHVLEVHAIDRRNQGRWHEHNRRDRKYLDDVVLLDGDNAQQRIEHEGDLAGEIGGVIGERLNVTLHAPQLRAGLLGPAHAVRF